MSFDLYFYKRKSSPVSNEKIVDYLSQNLGSLEPGFAEWNFENEDTGVYYQFSNHASDDNSDHEIEEPVFEDFEPIDFSFNINFNRPNFFGLEGFRFVEQFCIDLDLAVLDPQGEENVFKPTFNQLYESWKSGNDWATGIHLKDMDFVYLDEDSSNQLWEYNYQRAHLQEELGEDIFVPQIMYFREKESRKFFTMAIWPEHIPIILPPVDYLLLFRKYTRFFFPVEDQILVSRKRILEEFGSSFSDFSFPNCKIIEPNKAILIKSKFNSLKTEKDIATFGERIAVEMIVNLKPK